MGGWTHFRFRTLIVCVTSLLLTTLLYSLLSDPRHLSDFSNQVGRQFQLQNKVHPLPNALPHAGNPASDNRIRPSPPKQSPLSSSIGYRGTGFVSTSDLFKVKRELDPTETLSKYLKILGFTENPNLYTAPAPPEATTTTLGVGDSNVTSSSLSTSNHPTINVTALYLNYFSELPVAAAVSSGQLPLALAFIKSIEETFRSIPLQIFLYDVGLYSSEHDLLSGVCNKTFSAASQSHHNEPSTHHTSEDLGPDCYLVRFNFSLYPSHVNDLSLGAYRPLIIQELLNTVNGGLLWVDIHQFLEPTLFQMAPNPDKQTSDTILPSHSLLYKAIQSLRRRAREVGLQAWSVRDPTTTFTHPKMFEYFHVPRENYFFHRMVKLDALIIYNTASIHRDLMLPWVSCALTQECLAPLGAQSSGCRFDKKPFFRYSGCHLYDISALNVILGKVFSSQTSTYESDIPISTLFRRVFYDTNTDSIGTITLSGQDSHSDPLTVNPSLERTESGGHTSSEVNHRTENNNNLSPGDSDQEMSLLADKFDDLISALIASKAPGDQSPAPIIPYHSKHASILRQRTKKLTSKKMESVLAGKVASESSGGSPRQSLHPKLTSKYSKSYLGSYSGPVDYADMSSHEDIFLTDIGPLWISRYRVSVNGTRIEKTFV